MSFPQVSIVSSSKPPDISQIKTRPIANYHPSIWMDHFLSYNSQELVIVDDKMIKQAEQQKKEVQKMLFDVSRNLLEKLKLVDSIQRLGISYHFENDIAHILEEINMTYKSLLHNNKDEDLNIAALIFRLLRQHGYRIPCEIFTKFTEKGKFEESLTNDARGILSLYEAAHMRVHGEDLLDEALDFSMKHLKNVDNSSSLIMFEIQSALKCPLRLALPRIKAIEYMAIYGQDPSHNDILLTFSKLDFNMVQKLHQKELEAIARWWKDLDIPRNFPFARDRIVELYFWVLGAYFEPHFSVAREVMTKVMGMIAIVDDIYDAYGTYEELQALTAAIQRWDINSINQLPEYMKFYCTVLFDIFEEIGKKIEKDESSYHIYFAKEAVKKVMKSYLKEAEWLSKKYKPNFKEYMEVASDTSAYSEIATISFLGMGEIVTKDIFEWVLQRPKIIEASKVICRLMDDIVSHEFEQQREHVVHALQCYMDQYSCSEEEACAEFRKQILDAWKDINEAFLDRSVIPTPILMRVLNLSRVINLLYKEEDGFTNSQGQTKVLIISLLVDPVSN